MNLELYSAPLDHKWANNMNVIAKRIHAEVNSKSSLLEFCNGFLDKKNIKIINIYEPKDKVKK